ncbi:MAG: hypothetical protein KDN19_13495 [Verrucomicrobiae bacterium]|nr:hypothetical protein [Verrucomicrobiae bacterium]
MAIVQDWKIRSHSHRCCLTDEPFTDGEEFYTCIFIDPRSDGYVRRDYAAKNWPRISRNLDPTPFSFWKSTYEAPVVEEKKEDIGPESAEAMLRRMIDEDDPNTENARYILALMLERKKTLRPVDEKVTEDRKLIFYEHKGTGDVFIVADPELKLDDLSKVQEEVSELLGGPSRKPVAADGDADSNSPEAGVDSGEPQTESEIPMSKGEHSPSELLHALKGQLDELIVQLSLGKAEAIDYVETHKTELSERITRAREALGADDKHAALRTKLDELRVQLALGRMETRDAYQAQREKIQHALDEARGEWHHLEGDLRDELDERSESFKTKLNALALDVGLAKEVAEDELETRKEEFVFQARRLADRFKKSKAKTTEEIESFAGEARESWDDLKDNLRRLFHQ